MHRVQGTRIGIFMANKFNHWQWLRSGLRSLSRRYPPVYQCLAAAKRPAPKDAPPRQKVAYECAICGRLNTAKNIAIDHRVPAGQLLCAEDIQGFIERLFCGTDGLQAICKDTCHRYKTLSERLGVSFEEAKIEATIIDMLKNKAKVLAYLQEKGYSGVAVSNQTKRRALLREILKGEK